METTTTATTSKVPADRPKEKEPEEEPEETPEEEMDEETEEAGKGGPEQGKVPKVTLADLPSIAPSMTLPSQTPTGQGETFKLLPIL